MIQTVHAQTLNLSNIKLHTELFVWLSDRRFTTRQHKISHIAPFRQGGEPALVVKDSWRNTILYNNGNMKH